MILVLSDTHAESGLDVGGALARDLRRADLVVHAGDFTTEPVLDDLIDLSDRLFAVHGNADDAAVTDRLPSARVFERGGIRFAVTHRQRGGEMGLAYFGRERGADVVVSGHTHRPTIGRTDDVLLLDPGSHAKPRGAHPTYAVVDAENGAVNGAIYSTDGTVLEQVAPEGRTADGGDGTGR